MRVEIQLHLELAPRATHQFAELTLPQRTTTHARAPQSRAIDRHFAGRSLRGRPVGSVIKKRRKKMRKHKKRKLLRRARHKRKR